MEFSVEVGDGVTALSEPAPSPSAPSNPALDAARTEYQKAMTDPSHPHYEGLRRGHKTANDWAASLYLKAFPASAPQVVGDETAPLVLREGLSLTTDLTGSGRYEQARADALTALQQEFSGDFTPNAMPEDSAAIRASLQRDWGSDFESRWAGAENVGTLLLQHNPRLFFEAAALLGDARGLRLLDAIRQTISQGGRI